MKWLTVFATLMTIGFAAAGTARADDKATANKGVEGSWEGQVIVSPQVSLRITLDVAKGRMDRCRANGAVPTRERKTCRSNHRAAKTVSSRSPPRPRERPTRES